MNRPLRLALSASLLSVVLAPSVASAEGARFALGAGGISVPGTTSVVGATAAVVLPDPEWKADVRIGLLGWKSEDEYTSGKGGVLFLERNHYWGTYGLGYGSGLGKASFEKKKSSGWDGGATQLIVYFTPVVLRFGEATKVELSLDVGATRFFDPPSKNKDESGVRPFGMATLGVAF